MRLATGVTPLSGLWQALDTHEAATVGLVACAVKYPQVFAGRARVSIKRLGRKPARTLLVGSHRLADLNAADKLPVPDPPYPVPALRLNQRKPGAAKPSVGQNDRCGGLCRQYAGQALQKADGRHKLPDACADGLLHRA